MCNKEELEKTIDKSLIEELNQPEKFQFIIELQKFIICTMKLTQFYQDTIIFEQSSNYKTNLDNSR